MADWTRLSLVPNPQLKNLASAPLDNFRDAEECFDCVKCEDTGWVSVPGSRGLRKCECLKAKQYARLLDRIPPEYRGLDLANVQPNPDIHPGQESLIPALKEDP